MLLTFTQLVDLSGQTQWFQSRESLVDSSYLLNLHQDGEQDWTTSHSRLCSIMLKTLKKIASSSIQTHTGTWLELRRSLKRLTWQRIDSFQLVSSLERTRILAQLLSLVLTVPLWDKCVMPSMSTQEKIMFQWLSRTTMHSSMTSIVSWHHQIPSLDNFFNELDAKGYKLKVI